MHRFEGTVNLYTGDGIMALFGAPIAHEDHAQRACYAALHLRDTLRALGQELRREYGLDFQTRIGLNSGDVIVGKIGDDLRMDYTARVTPWAWRSAWSSSPRRASPTWPRPPPTPCVATLRRGEFLYEAELYPVARCAFKHPLTQEVAYQSVGEPVRLQHLTVRVHIDRAYRPQADLDLIARLIDSTRALSLQSRLDELRRTTV